MSKYLGPRVKFTLRLPPALHDDLIRKSLEQKTSLQALILEKLKANLK